MLRASPAPRLVLVLLTLLSGLPRVNAADDVEPTFRHEPLKKLLADLKDKDVMVRRQAATTLGFPDGSQGKGGPRPRGDLWPAMFGLVDALKDDDMTVRANSVKSLGLLMRYRGIPEKSDPRAETIALAVIAAIKDSEDLVRTHAAQALAAVTIETKPGLKAIAELLKDDSEKVRAAAAEGMKGVRPIADAVPALAGALPDKSPIVRLAAVNTLIVANREARGAVKPLTDRLTDDDDKVSNAAAIALGGIGPEAKIAVPALVDVIADSARRNRSSAVTALGMIRQDTDLAVPALIGALAVTEIRGPAIYALSAYGTGAKPAVPALLGVSRDENGIVRPDVLIALGEIDPTGPGTADLLFAALSSSTPHVRTAAVDYCARKGPEMKDAIPALLNLFRVDGTVRTQVAYALGSMGPEAIDAVPMLLDIIQNPDTNQHLRRVLINTVRAIDPEAIKPPGKK